MSGSLAVVKSLRFYDDAGILHFFCDSYASMRDLVAANLIQLGYAGFWVALFDDFRAGNPRCGNALAFG